MRVNEYIYRNWANWNFAILKQLCEDEGIEWSEELVAYLKKTPTNTNWSMLVNFGIDPYGCDDGGEAKGEVWFTGTAPAECSNGIKYAVLTETSEADRQSLVNAPNDYSVSVNEIPLPKVTLNQGVVEFRTDDEKISVAVGVSAQGGEFVAVCPTDISGTVEVTVTKK